MKKLVALVVLGLGLLLHVPAASAVGSVTAVGWWTRSPLASAPEGGITVGNAPDGPLSVAAVEVDLGADGVTSGILSMEQAGGAPPGAGQLVACMIGSFGAATGGTMEEAPATTCDATLAVVAVNGTAWSVDIGDLVGTSKGRVGIALVPATGSTGVWDLQLDKPSFSGTAARPTTATTTAHTTATTTAPSSADRTQTTFAVAQPPPVAAPVTTTTVVAATDDATATTLAASVVPNASETPSSFSGNAGGAESKGRPIGQAITLVALAALVGVGAGVAHRVAENRLPV